MRATSSRRCASSPSPAARALAQDVDLHFRTPTYAKSEAALLAIHRSATTPGQLHDVLWALTQYGGEETAALFHRLLAADTLPEMLTGPATQWVERQHAANEVGNVIRHAMHRAPERHWPFLGAIVELGGLGNLPAVEDLVPELADDELAYLASFAGWLGGSVRTADEIRHRVGDRPRDAWHLVCALAAMGDRATLDRALADLGKAGEQRWIEPFVVARSTRPEVPAALDRILATGDPELVAGFVDGLLESRREDRLALLTTVLAKRPVPAAVAVAGRRTLAVMRDQGIPGAGSLAATLPPDPDHDDDTSD